jgi:hypothetical protein
MAAYFQELETIVDQLEAIVDRAGLGPTLTALAEICIVKARHSPTSAWHWMRLGTTLEQGARCCDMIEINPKPSCSQNR